MSSLVTNVVSLYLSFGNARNIKNTAKCGCCVQRQKRLVHNQSLSSTHDLLKGTTAVTVKNPFAVFKNNKNSYVTFKRVAAGSCATNVCCWRRTDSLADINAIP